MFLISFNFKINCIYYGSYSYQVFHMKIDTNVCIQGTIYKQKKITSSIDPRQQLFGISTRYLVQSFADFIPQHFN